MGLLKGGSEKHVVTTGTGP